jgi:hypothetical protein
MDREASLILSMGGVLQLAGIAAGALLVYSAYRVLHGRPMRRVWEGGKRLWKRARAWWPFGQQPEPPVTMNEHPVITGTVDVTQEDQLGRGIGVVAPPPTRDEIAALREDLARLRKDHEQLRQRLGRALADAAAEAAAAREALAKLSRRIDDLSKRLDDLETSLNKLHSALPRLMAAAEASHPALRIFVFSALMVGVSYVTWPQWFADHLFDLAVGVFVGMYWFGLYAVIDHFLRRPTSPVEQ